MRSRGATGSLFRRILPPSVHVAEMDPAAADIDALAPEERALVERAVAQRRSEFAAGRQLARNLLVEALGEHRYRPLLARADRQPAWPHGVVGSITHCPGLVAAALARRVHVVAIGIDAEPWEPLAARLDGLLLHHDETHWLDGKSPTEAGLLRRWLFSTKEATYKAIYPATGVSLTFTDVVVTQSTRRFVATLRRAAPPFAAGTSFCGFWTRDEEHLVTALVIPRSGLSFGDGQERD